MGSRTSKALSCSLSFSQSTSGVSPLLLALYFCLTCRNYIFFKIFFTPVKWGWNQTTVLKVMWERAIAGNRHRQHSKLPCFRKPDYKDLDGRWMTVHFPQTRRLWATDNRLYVELWNENAQGKVWRLMKHFPKYIRRILSKSSHCSDTPPCWQQL